MRKAAPESTLEEKETAEAQLAWLGRHRAELTGLRGVRNLPAIRQIKPNTQRQAFKRLRDAIELHCPEMSVHLAKALKEDTVANLWTYEPDEKMEWNKENTRR